MYKLHLIFKYLRRRKIAWVSLAAVTLCTAMVIVVISVMGGWLRMFEDSARGMTGDILIKSDGLSGFPYYEEMIAEVKKLPIAVAAVPQIKSYGLVNIGYDNLGRKTEGVQVLGLPIDEVGLVNSWPQSLYIQHTAYIDQGLEPPAKKTFDLRQDTSAFVGRVPPGVADPLTNYLDHLPWGNALGRHCFDYIPHRLGDPKDPNWRRVFYLPYQGSLVFTGKMTKPEQDAITAAAGNKAWREAVRELARESNYPGMIAGARLLEVRKDIDGNLVGRDAWKYRELWAKLTVFGVGANQEFNPVDRAERTFWIIDDSRTGNVMFDGNAVYVDFHVLQADLGMQATETEDRFTGQKFTMPARTSEINIRLVKGTDLMKARDQIAAVVKKVVLSHAGDPAGYRGMPSTDTWRQASQKYLDQIEREKVMMTILFGVISIVAVFLIFCIFFMIVAEKTRDIGIIKSVGATNGGVAGIFLGYGLVIGIVGAAAGLLVSHLIVHNINEIHEWLGRTFRLVVYNPEIYAFETIPNTMDPTSVSIILAIAILASVTGSLIPAILAAKMQPVEALRSE